MARLTVIDTGIWQKTGNDTISRNTYFGILGGTLTWGCVLSFILLQLTVDVHFNLFEMIGYGIALPLFGIFISVKSNKTITSFLSFSLITVGISIILGSFLSQDGNQYQEFIQEAALLTADITFLITVVGICHPKFFTNLKNTLFVVLITYLVILLVVLFFNFDSTWLSYIGASIFSLYIGYDMYRATQIPATPNNAIDIE